MSERSVQEQAAIEALQNGEKAEGAERTERLLEALTHAVLALAAPAPEAASAPPPVAPAPSVLAADAPRALHLLALMHYAGGKWDDKRAGAAYKAFGLKADNGSPADRRAARTDLSHLAEAQLIRVVSRGTYSV
ncbi:hypothetical protein [Streptomyces sp. VRA16 Mangrove soil]|uniref:hypothetical protein n=1 Tax=Streptomyces sp. VRA16 Mangrove soil TaxID=2817434 RepID=UPI001A9E3CCF|nr:hypothetical protein [Streptomyces sp. VRA16 Mangrove soil]MBO1332789.1 hypothetical protein [Streptomyces sp. VRA16 Mangrove soil]